eukprot:2139642-Lingulodinium_polyedra.AAC.1
MPWGSAHAPGGGGKGLRPPWGALTGSRGLGPLDGQAFADGLGPINAGDCTMPGGAAENAGVL